MKYKQLFFVFFFFLSITSFSQTESEPNGSFEDANSILINNTLQGLIQDAGDEDYFKFEITQPGIIKFELLNVPENVDLHLRLFNASNNDSLIIRHFTADIGEAFTIYVSTCKVGTHYLFLEDGGLGSGGGGQFNINESYKFNLDFIPFSMVDQCECNNETINSACEIELGVKYSPLIAPWYKLPVGNNIVTPDLDYYSFEITQLSQIHIQVTEVPENIELEIFVYNPQQEQIWSDYTKDDGESYDLWFTSCSKGTHYIFFRDGELISLNGGKDFNVEVPYSFKIDTISLLALDSFECNNSFDQAASLELCKPINAVIGAWNSFDDNNNRAQDDIDYFFIELEEGTEVEITLENFPMDHEPCLRIYDSSKQFLEKISSSNNYPINRNFTPQNNDTYYFEVSDCNKDFNISEQYTFSVGCNLISNINDQIDFPEINISPNPVTNNLRISVEELNGMEFEITIFDLLGNSIYSKKSLKVNDLNIDTRYFPNGLLIVQINLEGHNHIQKITKI